MSRRFPSSSSKFPEPPKTKIDRAALRETVEILRYLTPYRGRFVFGLGCLFVGSVAGLCFPLLAGGLIDAALHSNGVTLPILGALTLNAIAAILAGTIAVQALAAAGAAMSFGRVGQTALADLRSSTDVRKESLRLIFEETKKGTPLVFGEGAQPVESTDEILFLDPLVVVDRKTPDFTQPRETKFEEFVRTGTLWQKGRVRFWAKGDRGIMLELRF